MFGFLNYSSVTILGFPELDLSSIVYQFQRLNDIKLPILLTVELNIFYFSMVWFIAVGCLLKIKVGILVLRAAAISEIKRINFTATQL